MVVGIGVGLELHKLRAIFARVIEDKAVGRSQCLLLEVGVGIREVGANDLLFPNKKKEQIALALKQLVKLIRGLAWPLGADYLHAGVVAKALYLIPQITL